MSSPTIRPKRRLAVTRRDLFRGAAAAAAGAAAALPASPQSPAPQSGSGPAASLHWLSGAAPFRETGVSFGVPFARGEVSRTQTFSLTASDGHALPVQQWPLAYWPDGSMKWIGFATVANAPGELNLSPGSSAAPGAAIKASATAAAITIDTGKLQARVPTSGSIFLDDVTVDSRRVAGQGKLVASLEDRSAADTLHFPAFTSSIGKATLEQSGPVRAVVKIEGVHRADRATAPRPGARPVAREFLPFTLRLYFYAGSDAVRLIHSFVFDGDDKKDFIKSLGLSFSVPMREQIHNRHVRFSGAEDGLWAEPVQPATGRRLLPGSPTQYADQLAGKRLPNRESFNEAGQKLLKDWASWNDYKLSQTTADGFSIQKRVNGESCWLDAAAGHRASGLVFAGDVSGGLAVSLRNFWQAHPSGLEVHNATKDTAEVRVWLWSPDAPAMDLRHYDLVNGIEHAHDLDSSYEDVQPGFSTAHGVGRTSELMLFAFGEIPSRDDTARCAELGQDPPMLAAKPERIRSAGVFGIWSLPDRSTAAKRAVEDQLDEAFALYRKEVEQRHWYGFWNFGDVMHQHDGPRHMWRYDIGGFAWDNTELGTDMWFWYNFLRSGRHDAFRMAEAITRHTSEVDVYHLGRFAGLGSRHNVRHWGCGAKEPRISQAAYKRFLYYLTTDERAGDLMRAVVDADVKTVEIDPMREAAPVSKPNPWPGRVRGGPDWLAFVGNWMTEWERTGNTKYRDKIIAGMDSIAAMPYWFLTGPNQLYGYEPATGKLHPMVEDGFGGYNLTVIMGGAEVIFELNELIDHPGWKKAWLQYCRLTSAPKNVVANDIKTGTEGADAQFSSPGRLAGYAYMQTKNPAFAQRALSVVVPPPPAAAGGRGGRGGRGGGAVQRVNYTTVALKGPDVLTPIDEVTGLSTNTVSQNCLQAIEVLAMAGSELR